MSLFRSQYVTVFLAQVGGLPAVVETEDEREVLLSLSVSAPAGFQRVLDRPVRIECVSSRGIQRVTGLAAWRADQPDQLRVAKEVDEAIQRRDAVRVQAVAPVVLKVLELPAVVGSDASPSAPPPEPLESVTLNVSITGVLVRDPAQLPMGTRLSLELALVPGEPPIAVTGRIVREFKDEKGVFIDEISAADQNRLGRYINEKQRAELRMSRR